MIKDKMIGIIGAGNMAGSLIHGMVSSGLYHGNNILINNKKNVVRIDELVKAYDVKKMEKSEIVQRAGTIILAVKPQDVFQVLEEINQWLNKETLVISMAAGISIEKIVDIIKKPVPLIRVMPNTSAKVLLSATAMAKEGSVKEKHIQRAKEIFSCVGIVREVSEGQMDAITGLSGSGPAYVYSFLEAMIEGGETLGLSNEESKEFAIQTLKGAVEMIKATGNTPKELSAQICSPNGTTVAGLKVLKDLNFKGIVMEAIKAAAVRSRELRMSN